MEEISFTCCGERKFHSSNAAGTYGASSSIKALRRSSSDSSLEREDLLSRPL
jgi:hypothetical protein